MNTFDQDRPVCAADDISARGTRLAGDVEGFSAQDVYCSRLSWTGLFAARIRALATAVVAVPAATATTAASTTARDHSGDGSDGVGIRNNGDEVGPCGIFLGHGFHKRQKQSPGAVVPAR